MIVARCLLLALALSAGAVPSQPAQPLANLDADRLDDAPLNRMRMLGSHNSYRPAFTEQTLPEQRRVLWPESAGLDFSHPPIARQLELGLRQLEFDPLADPDSGLYAAPYVGQGDSYAAIGGSWRAWSSTSPIRAAIMPRSGGPAR